MKQNHFSPTKAVEEGYLFIAKGAFVADDVIIVPFEDDGINYGIISIGENTKIRAGAKISSGVSVGVGSMIGHNCVLRARASVGDKTTISHLTCIERDVKIGSGVRVSALTHLTGGCVIEDRVHMGARVATINDRDLVRITTLNAPVFREGARIGSGATIMAGVEIGTGALVGAGSVVLKDVPPFVMVFGVPAKFHKKLNASE